MRGNASGMPSANRRACSQRSIAVSSSPRYAWSCAHAYCVSIASIHRSRGSAAGSMAPAHVGRTAPSAARSPSESTGAGPRTRSGDPLPIPGCRSIARKHRVGLGQPARRSSRHTRRSTRWSTAICSWSGVRPARRLGRRHDFQNREAGRNADDARQPARCRRRAARRAVRDAASPDRPCRGSRRRGPSARSTAPPRASRSRRPGAAVRRCAPLRPAWTTTIMRSVTAGAGGFCDANGPAPDGHRRRPQRWPAPTGRTPRSVSSRRSDLPLPAAVRQPSCRLTVRSGNRSARRPHEARSPVHRPRHLDPRPRLPRPRRARRSSSATKARSSTAITT